MTVNNDPVKYIGAAEFAAEGYLQEVNRRFLHPLGLALEILVDGDGVTTFGGVWDFRDDPEGMNFGDTDNPERLAKKQNIDRLWDERRPEREAALGYMVQPVDD